MWFENNVAYTENVPTTVTITETKAPVGCTAATMPWVFNWNYNYESYQLFNRNNMPSGSWDTADHSNVFNLTNQCDEGGKGGSGGEETPKPTHKPTVVKTVTPSETLANTGTSTNGILAIAVAMLLASIGFAVSPRLGRTDA
jgi:LPXTG-motif cell wall-anchored protein